MTTYVVSLDITTALAPPGRCAHCGSRRMVPAPGGEAAAFVCCSCGYCWRVELGWARRAGRRRPRQMAGASFPGGGDIQVAAVIYHGIDLDIHTPGPGTGGYLLFTGSGTL